MANIREVAEHAGVSPSTVSRVMNGSKSVDNELRKRVMDAVDQLKYAAKEKNQTGARLKVGIIASKYSGQSMQAHPAIYTVITSFIHMLEENNIDNILLLIDDDDIDEIESYFNNLLDGYLIIGTSPTQEDAILDYFRKNKTPYIIINRWIHKPYINYVNIDDMSAAYLATTHLIKQNHRKIAYIGGNKEYRHSELRLLGYKKAMKENDVDVPPNLIFQGEYSEKYGYEAGKSLFSMIDKPTAAFTAGDLIAIGLQSYVYEHGFFIPNDLSLVTFGSISPSPFSRPKLTAIDIPFREMGEQAATALIMQMNVKKVVGIQILMDAPLNIRESTKKID
ncbi:MAG: LacI family DNA-binding transcriptional regulator [Bacillota bacterium]|nr:LacI family DNA-binding transcriptional regulator [Bacillota bacterium]